MPRKGYADTADSFAEVVAESITENVRQASVRLASSEALRTFSEVLRRCSAGAG
jgi:hypothetical protein